jgi:type VI secretion system protein ImpC
VTNPFEDDLETRVTLERGTSGVVDEPPFRLLFVGDWAYDGPKPTLGERPTIEIDRDNFDEVMGRLNIRLKLDLPSAGPLELEFANLDDFHPDTLFARVPLFAKLRDLRARLRSTDTFYDAAREVRAHFGESESETTETKAPDPEPDEPAAEGGLLDAILTAPTGGAAKPVRKDASDIGRLVADLVRPHLVAVDENEQAASLAAVDAATAGLMRSILHDRRFQKLEAAWRGMYFVVRRTETSSDLKLFLLDISRPELTADLASVADLADSRLFEVVARAGEDEPWAAVLGNYCFGPNVQDVAALMRVGQIARAARTPFISHMRPDVFGVRSLADHPDPTEWSVDEGSPAGKLWATIRGASESGSLGLSTPRFLARMPYGGDSDPLEAFAFEEFVAGPSHDEYLWANPCFAIGELLARSFARKGWEMDERLEQDIEGLPLHMYKADGETKYQPCAEITVSERGAAKLVDLGFMPLVSFKSSDRVRLTSFRSINAGDPHLQAFWNRR